MRDVDESVVDVVLAGREVKRAPVVDAEASQLGLASTPIAERLLEQQRRHVFHPVDAHLATGGAQHERGGRRSLAVPQLKRVARIANARRQTHVRRLTHSESGY